MNSKVLFIFILLLSGLSTTHAEETTEAISTGISSSLSETISSNAAHLKENLTEKSEAESAINPEILIANILKSHLENFTETMIHEKLEENAILLSLMDETHEWESAELRSVGQEIIPSLNQADLNTFIDKIAENVRQNSYLINVLKGLTTTDFKSLNEKEKTDGREMIQNLVSFSVVLDNLVTCTRKDIHLLRSVRDIWERKIKSTSVISRIGMSGYIKLYSVKYGIDSLLYQHSNKHINPDFCAQLVPINIFEATLLDFCYGNFNNAQVGLTLTAAGPVGTHDPDTECAPATFTNDHNAMRIFTPFTRQYNDLYTVWNLGLVSQFGSFPYLAAKLLIPSVSGYHKESSEYIYHRMVSLMGTGMYMLNKDFSASDLGWSTKAVTETFGQTNKQSAAHYQSLFPEQKTISSRVFSALTLIRKYITG